MGRKLTINDFIKSATKVHGHHYDYNMVKYVNSKTKVKIGCPDHGIFMQTPEKHIHRKHGCPDCSKTKKLNNQTFIERAEVIHDNQYRYHLCDYRKAKTKIKILCLTHGIFEQTPSSHIDQRTGCPICSKKHQYSTTEFITEAIKIHGDSYGYSLVDYTNNYTNITLICGEHGSFLQSPSNHLSGKGCPICKNSKSENIISQFLLRKGIKFLPQHKFDDCKHKRRLPFDFYLPDYNTCIEFNGKQHYKPIEFFGGEDGFNKQLVRDAIKKTYCENQGIRLLIIKYDENILNTLNEYYNPTL